MSHHHLRLFGSALFVLIVAFSRWIPHAPNFSPLLAVALWAGAVYQPRWLSWVVVFAALLLSDLVIGLYHPMWPVYLSVGLVVAIGFFQQKALRGEKGWGVEILASSFGSSVLFFVLTNWSVWQFENLYPKTFAGLVECYVAALPFFNNTLLSTGLFSLVFFWGYQKTEAWLAERQPARR